MRPSISSLVLLAMSAGLPAVTASAQALFQDVVVESTASPGAANLEMATAADGTRLAAFSVVSSGASRQVILRRSANGRAAWTDLQRISVAVPVIDVDVAVDGQAAGSAHVYLASATATSAQSSRVTVLRIGLAGGAAAEQVLGIDTTAPVRSIAIATDGPFPAITATPYSVGVAWIEDGAGTDTLRYAVSVNGGATFLAPIVAATASAEMRSVSITYLRSASGSNGRYLLAWDEFPDSISTTGRILATRNQSTVDGAFVAPMALDSTDPATTGRCRDPRAAAQANNIDNSSAGPTGFVVATCDVIGTGERVAGFYIPRAHFDTTWLSMRPVPFANGVSRNADVVFSNGESNFQLTYVDAAGSRLAQLIHPINVAGGIAWTSGTTNYADSTSGVLSARPRVDAGATRGDAGFVWATGSAVLFDGVVGADPVFANGFEAP